MFYVWKFIVGHRFDTHPPFQAEILLFFPLFLLSYYNPAPLWDLPLLSPSPLLSFSFSSSCFFFFFTPFKSLFQNLLCCRFVSKRIVAKWATEGSLNFSLAERTIPGLHPSLKSLLSSPSRNFSCSLGVSSHCSSLPPFLLFVCHPAVDPDECSLLCPAKNECKKWTCVHCGQSVGVWGPVPFKNGRRSSCAA